MDSQRSHNLIPWAVRSHLVGMLALGLGFGLSTLILAPAYVAAAKAVAGGLKALAVSATPVAESFQFLTGPVDRLDTVGGYLSYKIFPDIALLVGVYAAIQGAQVLRGSESRGIFDIWYAAGRTRNAILRDRIAGFLLALSVIVLCVYAFTVLGGSLAGVHFALPALGQCVAVGLVGLFSFALGLFASQFWPAARTAAGISCAYLVAAFFVANMADHLGALTFVRYLSPFYYYIHERTLVPGVGFGVASAATLVVAAAMLIGAAWRLFLHRDVGGVSLARVQQSRPPDYTFHPSLLWHRWLWLDWIAEQPVGIAAWVLGIATFTGVEAWVVPSAIRIVSGSRSQLEKLLASHGTVLSTGDYLSFFMSFSALLVAGFTVAQVSRWVSDATQHRNDVVLTQPVSMGRFVIERAVTLLVLAALVALAVVIGVAIGAAIGGYTVEVGGLMRTFTDMVLLGFAIGGVGLLATVVFRNAGATGTIIILLVACFLLSTVAGLLSWPSWTTSPSVFDAFGRPYVSMPTLGSLLYLGGLGGGGLLAAYLAMRRGMRVAL
jgi:ABC-2 type transport system permease protein